MGLPLAYGAPHLTQTGSIISRATNLKLKSALGSSTKLDAGNLRMRILSIRYTVKESKQAS
jgi:hypothetical protein